MNTNRHLTLSVLFLSGMISCLTPGCKKEEEEPLELPATLTTLPVLEITDTSAICGGTIVFSGSSPVTLSGICWSQGNPPTVEDFTSINSSPSTETFSATLDDLTPNTTYYVRAYASNKGGTAYGGILSFRTLESGTVADYDGNIYHTVTIGTQVWMVENLRTTTYGNGDPVLHVTFNSLWGTCSEGAYGYYTNDYSYSGEYGSLYNYDAVTDSRRIAPRGWHIPTDADWTMLSDFLGGPDVAGGKLKEAGLEHWNSPNTGANNATGFSALPGGQRDNYNGSYYELGSLGYYWSTSENTSGFVYIRTLSASSSSFTRNVSSSKKSGYSVRCIRD